MKRLICAAMTAAIALFSLTGCKEDSTIKSSNQGSQGSDKLSVVATIFPEYDWAKQIIGENQDNAEITLLLNNGTDLHSYQPSVEDVAKISDCDLFIYVGGESDVWVDDALKSSVNKNMKVINLLDVLGDNVKSEEVVEGMQAEEHEDEDSAEEIENDEHVWLSIRNAEIICKSISDSLCEIDIRNADNYKENADKYISELRTLDNEYKTAVDKAKHKTLLFGDRFPFRYMTDDYNIDYYAAFVGCSAETEASFNTIAFLAGKLNELGLSHVMTTEKTSSKIAQTIISNSNDKNRKILALDSMQTTNSDDIKNGVTYLSVMSKNLEVLKEALD
ncbi:MAG: metal ABC transporter substrate-binding protein [Oscillospiraceae bacterium]|nr:metal ABC transporter substrate-binding protein [Oscillospiraceae bacterium]